MGRTRAVLRSFFGWLESTGETGFNPAASLPVSRYSPPVPQVLSTRDEKTMLVAISTEDGLANMRDLALVGVPWEL